MKPLKWVSYPVSSNRNGPVARRSPISTDFAVSIFRLGLPMSNVTVASWPPRENSSAGFGARSVYWPVMLATRSHGRFWIRPTLPLFGVKFRWRAVAGPIAFGSATRSNTSGMNAGVVPDRSTCSMRPATCALVSSLNLNSLNA